MSIRAGLLRQVLSSLQSTAAASVTTASVPSAILFVSGLNKRTTSERLTEAFSKFGVVVRARVIRDKASGCSKGFGFVRYATKTEAEQGIKGMDGQYLDGWVIFAEYTRPRGAPLEKSIPPKS